MNKNYKNRSFIMKEKILSIVNEVLENEQEIIIDDNMDLSELGMTSINMISIVIQIEEELGIEFNDDDLILDNLNTVQKLVENVEKARNK